MNVGRQCHSSSAAMAAAAAACRQRAHHIPRSSFGISVESDGGAIDRFVAAASAASASASISTSASASIPASSVTEGVGQRRSIWGQRQIPVRRFVQTSAIDVGRGVTVSSCQRLNHCDNQHQNQYNRTSRQLRSPVSLGGCAPRRRAASSSTEGGASIDEPGGYVSDAGYGSDSASTSTAGTAPASVKVSMDELMVLASQQPNALSLADMYRYASTPTATSTDDINKDPSQFVDVNRLRNAQFLHREMPIRLAQRAVDLLTLPHGLNRTREVQTIADTYLQYLQRIRDFPSPTNAETERLLTDMLRGFVLDRHSIPAAISRALQSLKDKRKAPVDERRLSEMEDALYRFFTARVGLRFITEHHVLASDKVTSDELYLHKLEREGCSELVEQEKLIAKEHASPGYDDADFSGCIQRNCDAVKEVRRTANRVAYMCRETYGIAPEIEIVTCSTTGRDDDGGVPFTYVPHHLRYILAEVLKNSCRATVRSYLKGTTAGQKEDHTKHHNDPDGGIHDAPSLPPIKVVVAKGAEDVTIKVADRGGGMPRSAAQQIWTFAHSTLNDESQAGDKMEEFGMDEFSGARIRGFGLPLARIYARYFGGEVTIKSMEGYGVDAYLYMPVLGVACENLPRRVIHSPGNLNSSATRAEEDRRSGKGDSAEEDLEAVDDEYKTEGQSRNDDFFVQGKDGALRRPSVLDTLNERAL